MVKKLSYKDAGVDISAADQTKREMSKSLKTNNPLVLNTFGAFASLVDGAFPGYEHPVLVCKTEEPGSKQLLALQHGRVESICFDMINHLMNDIIVMGAKPLFIQDLIVCGKMDKTIITRIVDGIAKACIAQGCTLTGGETSEQPGVLQPGKYVLGASGIGVVEKTKIIDGSAIRPGDTVLAVASSGLHTNGYTLVRALLQQKPELEQSDCAGRPLLDAILEPHRCYYQALKDLFLDTDLHGMAHITGGGIPGNLNRILPEGLDALIDCPAIRILPVFEMIKNESGNDDADMILTFNLGVGITLVVHPQSVKKMVAHLQKHDIDCYPIGTIVEGGKQIVRMEGKLDW